jgi:hypothetical protein
LICEDFSREAVLCKAAFGTPSQDAAGERRFDLGNSRRMQATKMRPSSVRSGAGLVSIEEPASRPGFDLHHGLRYGRLRHMDLGSSPAEIIAPRYRLEDPQMATA